MTRLTLSIARCVLAILCLQNTSRLSHACVWSCLIGFIIIIIGILFIIIIHILLDIVILFKTLPDCHTSVSSCLYHHHRQEGKLRRSAWLWINLNCHFSITSNLIWLTVHHLRLGEASTVHCVLGESVLPANWIEYKPSVQVIYGYIRIEYKPYGCLCVCACVSSFGKGSVQVIYLPSWPSSVNVSWRSSSLSPGVSTLATLAI